MEVEARNLATALDAEPEVADYVAALAADLVEEYVGDDLVAELAENFAAVLPGFAELGEDERTRRAARVVVVAAAAAAAAGQRHTEDKARPEGGALKAALQRSLEELSVEETEREAQRLERERTSRMATAELVRGVAELVDPPLAVPVVEHLLHQVRGDRQLAAEWLLDNGRDAAEERYQLHVEEQERAARHSESARAKVVERYESGADVKTVTPWAPSAAKAGVVEKGPKQRYLDGRVVTQKGERFIIEKPPDFDGGSRGKVITKGKRGKGYV